MIRNPAAVVETNRGKDSPVSTLDAHAYPSIASGATGVVSSLVRVMARRMHRGG